MPYYEIADDDDFPPRLSRQDLVVLRQLLIKIEEAGVIQFLSDDEIGKLRSFSSLMDVPGMSDAMIAQAAKHTASRFWASIRAKWYRAAAWTLGGFSTMIGIVLGLDQVAKAIRAWFR